MEVGVAEKGRTKTGQVWDVVLVVWLERRGRFMEVLGLWVWGRWEIVLMLVSGRGEEC